MSAATEILDPICEMIVELADAREAGLTIERPEREYAFCSHACLMKFARSPQIYAAKVDAWLAADARGDHAHAHAAETETPAIDAGMREWYKSCRCCLSDAHPEIVKALDEEKAAPTGQ